MHPRGPKEKGWLASFTSSQWGSSQRSGLKANGSWKYFSSWVMVHALVYTSTFCETQILAMILPVTLRHLTKQKYSPRYLKEEKEWLRSLHLVECRCHWLLLHWKDEEIPGTLVGRFALIPRYMHVSKATAAQKLHQSGLLNRSVSEFHFWPFDKLRGFEVDNR